MTGTAAHGSALAEWRTSWTVAITAMLGCSYTSIHVYSIGVFIFPLEAEFGWTRAQISSGMMILGVVGVLLSPFVGAAIDRWGPRRIGLTGAVLHLCTFASLSLVSANILSWWAAWLIVSTSAVFISPTVWAAAVSSLFHKSRGLALAVALTGTALSSMAVPALGHTLVEQLGWRGAYVGISLSYAVVTLPLLWLFFYGASDRQRGHARSGVEPAAPTAVLSGMTAREAFLSRKYLSLSLGAAALMFASGGILVNLVPILKADGLSVGTAAWIAGMTGIGTITGRLVTGWLLDRYQANVVGALGVVLPIFTAGLLLAFPGSIPLAIAAVLLLGLNLGSEVDAVGYLVARHFGLLAFGALFGTIIGITNLLLGVGPLVANHIYDLTRSYDTFLWIAIPTCLVASLFFLSVGRNPDEP